MPDDYQALKHWIGKQDISDPEAIRRLLRSHPDLKRYLGDGSEFSARPINVADKQG